MNSPFEGGRNEDMFREMLVLRFSEWARLRRNLLARRRYREHKRSLGVAKTYTSWDD